MRRIIIDTDTGSDDAVALIMALKSNEVIIEAVTTLGGNCELDQATLNALMTIEITNTYYPPVYKGSSKPLYKELETATHVHGVDGMGDQGLIYPTLKEENEDAIDIILELVNKYPNEIEIITIGPATNIAKAIIKDKEGMLKTKRIYAMGTAGLGPGNMTPVSEFNVYVDAESFKIMVESGIDITIIGFDLCQREASLMDKEFDFLLASRIPEAVYSVKSNLTVVDFNMDRHNEKFVDLPDPMAMAVLLWDDVVIEKARYHAEVITNEGATYGQVIFSNDIHKGLNNVYNNFTDNVTLIKKMDNKLYKQKLLEILTK